MLLRTTLISLVAALWTTGLLYAQAPDADLQKILDKYRLFRPADKDLAIFQLDWMPTLKDARERAAKEQRPNRCSSSRTATATCSRATAEGMRRS